MGLERYMFAPSSPQGKRPPDLFHLAAAHTTFRATVVIATNDAEAGKKLEEQLAGYANAKPAIFPSTNSPRVKFIACDTSSWDDEVHLFDAAASLSPTRKIFSSSQMPVSIER